MIGVPNRPFATEPLTGMMLPDGFFESSIGLQSINAHFQNVGASAADVKIYFESASHPAFLVTPETFEVAGLDGGAQYLASWQADVSGVPPGVHLVSFIAQTGTGQTRIIKKVFVTQVTFDPATKTLSAAAPEGKLGLVLTSVLGPNTPCTGAGCGCGCGCGGGGIDDGRDATGALRTEAPLSQQSPTDPATMLGKLAPMIQTVLEDPASAGCLPFYLLQDGVMTVTFDPPFAGQYSELPFQDPWWKVLLLIIAVVLAIAAIVVAAVVPGGAVLIAGLTATATCCAAPVASLVFGILGAGAVGSAGAAGLSDARDPVRRGEDNTIPTADEMTTAAVVKFALSYPEPIALGRPFAVTADWHYTRVTTGNDYTYSVSETNTNVHVLSEYDVTAPNIVRVYKREPFLVKAQFFDEEKERMRGSDLYVQCILEGIGPLHGRYVRIPMQDSGVYPDAEPSDGTYTGVHYFLSEDHGFWQVYVIAQDVNNAQADMTPEEAAQIIGGQIRTHQLTINFAGGTCPKVPDGEVHVLSDLGS